MQASTNWNQALNIWTTPWGFLKGAAANNATARQQGGQQVVSFSPPTLKSPSGQMYTVTGYINNQNLVTKVETRVEHAVVGDLLVEFEYSNYRNMNGVQVPGRIVQRQAGLETFNADITAATANPANLAELLTPPPAPARGGGGGAAPGAPAPGAAAPGAPAPGGAPGGGPRRAGARTGWRRSAGTGAGWRWSRRAGSRGTGWRRAAGRATACREAGRRAPSRSAATTPRSPSTWAITSSSSRAARATRAAWR